MTGKCWHPSLSSSEDFGLQNAKRILDRYRPHIACFNDDIQGTGCVTLAALLAALHVSKVKLNDVRVVCFGAGSAGTGIAAQIRDAIAAESNKSKDEALKQIWYFFSFLKHHASPIFSKEIKIWKLTKSIHRCIDKQGLLLKSQGDKLTPAQASFARDDWPEGDLDLYSVVKKIKPHVLIGTSTKAGAFTEQIIKEMARHVQHPIIFPLSNPTRLHEAQPKDIMEWTEGKALIATGSPFPPVEYKGVKTEIGKFYRISHPWILERTDQIKFLFFFFPFPFSKSWEF